MSANDLKVLQQHTKEIIDTGRPSRRSQYFVNKQFPKYLVYFSADVYVPTVDESKIPTNLTDE